MPLPTFLILNDIPDVLRDLDDTRTKLRKLRDDAAEMVARMPERYGEDGPKDVTRIEDLAAQYDRAIDYLLKKPKEKTDGGRLSQDVPG